MLVSALYPFNKKLLEYDKYWETMEYLLNRMKETNKAFKQEKKLLIK
uniref:DDE_Tnp_ISL3 domain-containing protein n=1 Tax=Heterorhabditis bacteriophora TaxID=37862 RepID=A0A1I7WGH2_HETBA